MNEEQASEEQAVCLEAAEVEFERFVEAMDLDLGLEDMDAEDLTAFKKVKRRFLKAVGNGSLIINEKGEAVFTPQRLGDAKAITFHERRGSDLMAMDGKKSTQDIAKTFAIMGSICRVHPNVFSKLGSSDLSICQGIYLLLMD